MKRICYLLIVCLSLFGLLQDASAQSSSAPNCQSRTYTQGGWGNTNGTPGVYLNTHFANAFPNGISIGCTNRLVFTTAAAVRNFLPSGSTPNCLPTGTLTNPSNYNNVLAGQILALSLSVYFDAYDPNYSSSSTPLSNQTITSGSFAGMSVGAFLTIANSVLGGCSTAYPYSLINQVATDLNENYDNGTSNGGFLACPPACNLTATTTAGNIRCNGQSTTVIVSASGGVGPYTGTGTFTRSAGTYTFPVSSANGCTTAAVVTLTQPAVMAVSASNSSIACHGGTTNLVLTATGGTSPYTGTGTFTRTAGAYSYTVSDSRNCTVVRTGTITQPNILTASVNAGTILGNGLTTTVSISANGGTAPYTGVGVYTVSAGAYSYTVTDARGCLIVVTGTLSQPALLVASATNNSVICNGGTATVNISASGGVGPYTGVGTYTRLAGPYSYTVTDANGNTSVVSGTITQPSALTLASTTGTINCNGGSTNVNITANGGTGPYTINGTGISGISSLNPNGAGSFSVIAGPYSYTVTDANGCKAVVTGTMIPPTVLTASASNGTILGNGLTTTVSVSANGGTAPYTGVGVYTVSAGAYSYTVTDARGCLIVVTGTLSQPALLVASATNNSVICNGGTATVNVSATGGVGPYTGVGTYTRLAGPYTYTVTDANGNTSVATGTIAQPSALSATGTNGTINCNGGSTNVNITANGGTGPYTVNGTGISGTSSLNPNGAGSFSVIAGPYSYTVTDANGCKAVVTGTMTQPTVLTASASNGTILGNGLTTTVSVSANGGTAPYTGVGPYTLGAGPYSFTVTDANGCLVIVTGTLTQPALLVASATNNSVMCNGGTATVNVSASGGVGPYTGVGTYTRLAGPYTYTVTDANGNTSVATGTIAQPSALSATGTNGTINCNGGTTNVNITANGGTGPYTINGTGISGTSSLNPNGAGSFSVIAGPYSYTVTDANGCKAVVTGTMTQPTVLTASASNGTILGNGLTTTVSVSANGGTAPYTGVGVYTVSAGAYSYTVTDANGCLVIVTGTLTQPALLVASATNNSVICNGGTATVNISASGGVGPYTGVGTYTRLAGPYSYTVTDANGNTSVATGTIAQPSALSAAGTNGTINCNGGTTNVNITANGGTGPYTINGTGISGTSSLNPNGAGSFSVIAGPYSYTVTDANGCKAVVTGTMTQPTVLTASASNGTILGNGLTTTVSVSANGGTAPYTGVGVYTVSAGAYSYTVTDARGCLIVVTGTLTQPALLVASATNNSVMCNGGTATVNISASGGVGPYTGVGTYTRLAGPYSYTVTDANGNTSVVTGTITQPSALTLASTTGTINCNGGSTNVNITANGGTGPYTINGTGINGSTAFSANGAGSFSVIAGPYSYTVTDANGCKAVVTGTMTQPTVLTASASNGTILGNGLTTTVSISANGGTAPYTGVGTYTLGAGPYSFTVTDARGCLIVVTGTLTQPALLVASATNNSVMCNGGTATVNISASGGVGPYTGVGTYTRLAGPYSYTVTDANGNTSVVTGTITQPSALTLASTTGTINCNGGSTNVNITANGGTGPYTINGTGISGTSSLNPNGAGSFSVIAGPYSYTVTDANGCKAVVTGTMTQPTVLTASASNGTILGNGLTTTVSVSANGGTAPYTGVGTYTLGAGPYSYTVTDANGCLVIVTGSLTQPALLVASATNNSVMCNGGTATVNISASGGVGPYTGVGTYTRLAGPYTYTVTDANGNTSVATGTIAQPSALTLASTTGTINCNGGSTNVNITANGGTGPYTINGTGISGTSSLNPNGAGSFSVNAGLYSYTVTDANGCKAVVTGTMTQPSALTASASNGTILGTGLTTTVSISANGGTAPYTSVGTYTLGAGPYSYTVTDANGCLVIVTGTLTQPALLVASATNNSVICNGGTATVNISASGGVGPYTGVGTYTRLAGPYSYTVTDANGNTSVATGTIAQPSALSATGVYGTINCNGGTTNVNITANGGTGPYTVNGTGINGSTALSANGAGSFSVIAGPYSYTVTDANGCKAVVTGTMTQPTVLTASASNGIILGNGLTTTVSISANGGTAPYTGVGTYTLGGGPYSYTVTDARGCLVIVTGSLTQPALLVASATNNSVMCNGGTATVNVSATGGVGPYTGVGTYTRLAGPYSYTVTDANGNTSVVTGTITQPSALTLASTTGTINCNGGSTNVNITANGGTGPYTINGTGISGTSSLNPNGAGSFSVIAGPYSYTVTDANGCKAVVTGTMTQPTVLTASASNGTILGNGLTTTVSVSANGGTAPYTGVGTYTLGAGPYSFTVTDARGCLIVVTGTLTQPALLVASATNNSVICNGGTATVNISASGGVGPYTGVGTFTRVAGPYTYTVTDANGNTSVVTGTITQPSALNATAVNGSVLCFGGTTTLTINANGGTAPYTGTGTYTVTAGPYTYTVTDANGCQAIATGTITQPSSLSITATTGTILTSPPSATISITANGGTPGYTGTGVYTLTGGPYSYTVTDANACPAAINGIITLTVPLVASSVHNSVICHGGSATVAVSATGGVGPYTGYGVYDDGEILNAIIGSSLNAPAIYSLVAGPYSFTVTDANGNTAVTSGTIVQPPVLTSGAAAGTVNCFGNTTTVNITSGGGSGPYTIAGTGLAGSVNFTGQAIYTLSAGPYSYTITDANGCTIQENGAITQPSQLNVTTSTGTITGFGMTTTVAVTANGGTPAYNGTGVYTVSAGPYSYTVTDANGCQVPVSGTLTQPALLVASSVHNSVICYGGSATVAVSATGGVGPYTGFGVYDDGEILNAIIGSSINAPAIYSLVAGPYSFTVTDANGNTAVTSGTIVQAPYLSASVAEGTILCNGSATTLTISATGGTPPYINAGTQTVSAGPYAFTISDANSCSTAVTGLLTEPSAITIGVSTGTLACFSGTVNAVVTATGGVQPYTGIGTFTTTGGVKTFTVSDANSCLANLTDTIAQPAALQLTYVADSIMCHGGSSNATLTIVGGTGPVLGNTGVFPVYSGTNIFFAQDANGCEASAIVLMGEPTELNLSLTAPSILCSGDSVTGTLQVTGGIAPYSGTGTVTVFGGERIFTVTDAAGCSKTDTILVAEPLPLIIETSGHIRCAGDSAQIVITGTGGIAPYTGTGTVTLGPGNYTLSIADTNNCAASKTISLVNPLPLTVFSTVTPILCHGDSAVAIVTATGGVAPYFGAGTYTIAAGTYTYGIIDSLCCIDTAIAFINQPPKLIATAQMGVIPCLNSETTVTVSATGGVLPYTGVTTYTVGAGSYTYQVQDANLCSSFVVMDVDTSTCLGFENLSFDQIYSTLVYPNPTSGKFTIRTMYTGKAQLISQSGQLIRNFQLEQDQEVNVEDLAKGLYFLITPRERIKIAVTSE